MNEFSLLIAGDLDLCVIGVNDFFIVFYSGSQ